MVVEVAVVVVVVVVVDDDGGDGSRRLHSTFRSLAVDGLVIEYPFDNPTPTSSDMGGDPYPPPR